MSARPPGSFSQDASNTRRVAANTAVQVMGKAALVVMGLASVAILTRYLGSDGYGRMALAFAYLSLFGVLADVGLLTVTVREISKRPERAERLVGNVIVLRLLLSLLVIVVAALVSLALPYAPDVRVAILIAGVALVFGMLNSALTSVFQAGLRMDRAVIAEICGRAAALAATVLVAALDLGFYAVVATAAIGTLAALLVSASLVGRMTRVRPRAERAIWAELLRAGIPVGIALALTEIYFRADTFIISLYEPYDQVGLYAFAFRVLELVATFPGVLLISVFPILSRYLAEPGDDRLAPALRSAGEVLVFVGVPLAAGAWVLAPDLVRLAAGDDFEGAALPLQLLLVGGAVAMVNGLCGYALIAAGRQVSAMWLTAAGLLFNVGLNLVLVPRYGIVAAAATAIASEAVILGGSFLLMRRHIGSFPQLFPATLRALAAAGAMFGVLWLLRSAPLAALLPLAVVVYGAVLFAVGGLDRDLVRRLRA